MLNWNREEVKALFVSFKTVFCHELRFHISVLPFILLTIVDWRYFWGIDNTARITKFLFSHILPAKLAILGKYFVSEPERSVLRKHYYSAGSSN